MILGIDEREEVCANCQHFIQHYVKPGRYEIIAGRYEIIACNAGHCTYPRLKDRKPGETCDKFEFKIISQVC